MATNTQTQTTPDFEVTGHGSIWLVQPLNDAAGDHLRDNVSDEAQYFGDRLVVEHRYIGSLVEALAGNGYRVRVL